MSRVFTKATTGIASADKYHPILKEHLTVLREMAEYAEANDGIEPADFAEGSAWDNFLRDCVICHAPGVYSVAYLHPRYCEDIMHEVSKFKHEPNLEEPESAQIPEVTLQDNHPVFYEVFRSFWHDIGLAYAKVLLNLVPDKMTSVQAALYRPSETPRGHWHTDHDSDVTLVVALNDDLIGGGTHVHQGPFLPPVIVEQNLTGWGMLFLGKTTLHYGLPVLSGERHLLVHWSETK
ncbi:hypothetical protein HOS76_gp20 [Pseudomonas phage Henninger]|uniref:Fe2OG dioxygenase domain-containing protein n=1 Tax=Pseudomonas phage Henninger TaxID=2079287 RepID=A0A2K9VHA6_9CAUD|nr:hypothetical protein HOS76_gp20 [Pseudomonas phage Henninger]AUV61714.1 hypothetical protein PsPhHenninger_gp33 [Pseudomonas phage Henninger]